MATAVPVSDDKINVENNVILTTKDEISVQQVFNYLTTNLDRFRIESEFVVLCGVHGSNKGELGKGDEDFRYDYESMFRWCQSEKHYNRCSPKSAKPFQVIEEQKYQMGRVVEVTSKQDETKDKKYVLTDDSKETMKNEFERILTSENPTVLILASCWSFRSEISNILSAVGLYSALNLLEDHGEISAGRMFKLDTDQKDFLTSIAFDETIKDVIVDGM